MERPKTAPAAAGAPRNRKRQAPDGSAGVSADPASAATRLQGTKKPRLTAPKGKAGKAVDEDELPGRDESRAAADESAEERTGRSLTGVFSRDLPWLMYGFGDADKPLKETVELVEEIAVQFVTDTLHSAMRAAAARSAGPSGGSSAARKEELRLEDLLFAVRKDPRKVARIQELIRRQQEIKDARRVITDMDGVPNEDMPDG